MIQISTNEKTDLSLFTLLDVIIASEANPKVNSDSTYTWNPNDLYF